jgi:hypothetical protein
LKASLALRITDEAAEALGVSPDIATVGYQKAAQTLRAMAERATSRRRSRHAGGRAALRAMADRARPFSGPSRR